ncbi:ATP-binding protein [Streptomyces sp. NPDC001435]|uniref:ATP-binding protein n=1 Tax=Streptomyces sp. NPDC001435 TaxID=3364576 RepID=UPI0036BD4081
MRAKLQAQQPSVAVAATTIHGWLNGDAVPGAQSTKAFLALTAYLQSRAAAKESKYVKQPEGWWQQLLAKAQAESSQNQGGRPRTTVPPPALTGPVTLPPASAGFTGRGQQLRQILAYLGPDHGQARSTTQQPTAAVLAVAGMGGVGKTALVLQAAHQARREGWFPGGVLYADMRGYSPESDLDVGAVAERYLRALGAKAKDMPPTSEEKRDAWHLTLNRLADQGRPLLAVLDNVRVTGQVSQLLPTAPHRAIVISRHTLSALSPHRVNLSPLTLTEAVQLVDQVLRIGNPSDERVVSDHAAACRLAELCGHLPLALRIIAALLRDEPARPLHELADELKDARTRLDLMACDDTDEEGRPLAVKASLGLSYKNLPEEQAWAIRLLAAIPGPDISTTAAIALFDRTDGRRLLAGLARAHLLQPLPTGRWYLHDLVSLFARNVSHVHDDEDQQSAAIARLMDHYVTHAKAASTYLLVSTEQAATDLYPDHDQALAWLDAEYPALVSTARYSLDRHQPAGTRLALALAAFFELRKYSDDGIAVYNSTVDVCRETGDRRGEGQALNYLGHALRQSRRFQEAIESQTLALEIFREIGDPEQEAAALHGLGTALWGDRRFEEALGAYRDAATALHSVGNADGEALALDGIGVALNGMRRFQEAVEVHTRSLEKSRESRNRHIEATALNHLGASLQKMQRIEEAVEAHRAAATIFHETGDRHREGEALNNLGVALGNLQRFEESIEASQAAIAIDRENGDPNGEGASLNTLAYSLQAMGRIDEAVEAQRSAVAAFQKSGNRHSEGVALNNLGASLQLSGRLEEAVEAHYLALGIHRETGDRHGEGGVVNNLGVASREMGWFDAAVTAHQVAVGIYRETNDQQGEVKAFALLLEALRAQLSASADPTEK